MLLLLKLLGLSVGHVRLLLLLLLLQLLLLLLLLFQHRDVLSDEVRDLERLENKEAE